MYRKWLNSFLFWLTPLCNRAPELSENINEARVTWKQALNDFNHITDKDLIDFSILHIKASERRYMALIRQARKQGVTAWPELQEISNGDI